MKLLRRELTKLFAQKRSYVGWGGLLAVPLLITLAFYLNRNNHHHDNGPGGVISLAFHNGILMPLASVAMLSAFLLPLRGLLRAQGPPMEEGFMLVFPELVLHGAIPVPAASVVSPSRGRPSARPFST